MTEENKINILNYLLGGTEPTSSDNSEIFLEQEDISKEIWEPFLPSTWNGFRFEGMITPDEKTTSLGVLYGGYLDTDNNACGIIILVDQNFTPVQAIYEFDSGTKLRYIQYMKQAEDGTFYFIDDTCYTYFQREQSITSQKRFVMVSNFTLSNIGTYTVHLRTSYILSGNYSSFYCKNMYKDPNSSHYIFFGAAADLNSSVFSFRILKIWSLKINVGSANEWTMYTNELYRVFGSAIASFEEGNVKYRCLTTNSLNSTKDLVLFSKTYTGTPVSSVMLTFQNYKPYIDDITYKKQSVFLDYDNVYFVQNNQNWGNTGRIEAKYIGLYKYDIANSQLKTIYEKSLGDYDFCNLEAIYIDKCNTDIYIQYNTNIDTGNKADYYFQRLVNDSWNPILIKRQAFFIRDQRSVFVKSNYNLLQICLYQVNPQSRPDYWYLHVIKEDYNVLNYNGTPYINYDSTISHKGEIYSDNRLVFARNLYDRTSYQNTTTSTIQIPSSYLNDIVLTPKTLISVNNNIMNNDTNELTKNVYENVLLNFVNTLNVIDEDTNILYPNSANYINENINTGTQTNYEDTSMTKIRINFADGSVVKPIEWEDISEEGLIAKQTIFSVYVSSELLSIDFINENEDFIYITKDYDFEVGNIYTVTQKVRIE